MVPRANRLFPAILLLLGGIASLAYGVLYHNVTVDREEEEEVKIPIPTPFGPLPETLDQAPPNDEQNPFESPSHAGGARPASEASNPFESPSSEAPATMEGPPWEGPPAGVPLPFSTPAPSFQTIRKPVLVSRDEPEWALIKEITVGGVARLANGRLKRTYSGQPPALCPT